MLGLEYHPATVDESGSSNTSHLPQGLDRPLKLHWRDAIRQPAGPENIPCQEGRDSMHTTRSFYNMARLVDIKHQRGFWTKVCIDYGIYTLSIAFVYFFLIGVPLWKGAVFWLYWIMGHKFVFQGGWVIVIAVVVLCVGL
jgi:hypothetical protein